MRRHALRTLLAPLLIALLTGCAASTAPATPATPAPAATAAAPSPAPAPPPADAPELGRPFELRAGEAAEAGPVTLTLLGIANDSRCPTQVSCAWEGAAEASVGVVVDGQDQGTHKLTLYGRNRATDESSVAAAGYTVRLVKIDPYPAEPKPIPAADYVALFVVEQGARAYTPVGDDAFEGVIVPEQDAGAFDPRAEGYWTPAERDVRALEAGLAEFLRTAAAERSPDLWRKQGSYKRQYAGLIRQGHRLVYASFLCSTSGDEWRRQAILVMDGGDCFFQLTYDVERGVFGDLLINGDA